MKALSIIIGFAYLIFFIIEVGGLYAGIKVRLLLRSRSFRSAANSKLTRPFFFLPCYSFQNKPRKVRIYWLASLEAIGLFTLATILALIYHFAFKLQIRSQCALDMTGSTRTLSGDSEPTVLDEEQAVLWCDNDWKSHARQQPAAVIVVSCVEPSPFLGLPLLTTER